MKQYIFIIIGTVLLLFASCNKILDEQPRAVLTPDLFKTSDGLKSGLTAAYNGLRYISGTEGTMGATVMGTDEFTAAASAGSKELDMTFSNGGSGINAASGGVNLWWTYNFANINTCNGIIEFGTAAGLSDALIAEAYFLRAYYYFHLVQMYGGVPLDLGSGNLKFNTTPTNLSKRNTQEEVYTAIISDMQKAEANLPIAARLPGCAFRATAVHYLAKIYLTHGDNQLALTEAEKILNPAAPYTANPTYGGALLAKYSDVIKPTNERNAEILFTCEHTETYAYNETAAGFGSGAANKDDRSCSYFVPNYQNFKLSNNPGYSGFLSRTVAYSRPWIRFRATFGLLNTIFADKTNDSRFNASFQTVWLNNNSNGTTPNGVFINQPIRIGDTAFVMLPYTVDSTYIKSKKYKIYQSTDYSRDIFPALSKFFDPNRSDMNDASGRPFLLAKLSETYLIAAEAAVNLNQNAKALQYVNILRTRAATTGNAANMTAATPATITIDYILDERSRELCGEQLRWFDLKRTGKWRARSTTYSLNGVDAFTRTIKDYYDLRPIPQGQINLMGNSADEKAAYQNPGYN